MLTPSLSLPCPPSLVPPGLMMFPSLPSKHTRSLAQSGLGYNVSELINLQPTHSPAVQQHFSFALGGFS